MYTETIGIVGGFGAYATLGFYSRLLEEFHTGYERDYPRILMDNNFTMPSRTRALLYGECEQEIITMIGESLKNLINSRADKIVLVCGTAHYFLEQVFDQVPEAKNKVIHMIELTADRMSCRISDREGGGSGAAVIAAEGCLKKCVYDKALETRGFRVVKPGEGEYEKIRYFIEGVKQNKADRHLIGEFIEFMKQLTIDRNIKNMVLGCTEFPVLLKKCMETDLKEEEKKVLNEISFWDPLELAIKELKDTLH